MDDLVAEAVAAICAGVAIVNIVLLGRVRVRRGGGGVDFEG